MSRAALERDSSKATVGHNPPPVPPQNYMLAMQQQAAMQQHIMMQQVAMQQAMMQQPGFQQMLIPMGVPQFVPIPEPENEEEEHISNVLPMNGSTTNFNINNLLYNNILENEYFKALYQLRTYHEVLDEIYRSVIHVEPWQTGTARFPSSAFCLMVKFMLMKLTLKQMNGLLATTDSALVRAIGFLYLRYTCPPSDLYKWYEPFLEDEEEFSPLSDKSVTMTVGAFVTKLLTDMQYYGTTLPRIPVPIERKMKVMLLLLNEKKTRRKNNLRAQSAGRFTPGAKVRAIYGDAENEPAWYEAVVESIDEQNENKYWVKFPEYGNTEHLDLGEMELLDGDGPGGKGDVEEGEEKPRSRTDDKYRRSESNDRDRGGRDKRDSHRRDDRDQDSRRSARDSRSRSRDRDRDRDRGDDRRPAGGGGGRHASSDNLMEKVLQNEREASAAVGRNYGHRPTSYKGSLSMQVDRYTTRQKSPPRESTYRGGGGGGSSKRRSPSPVRGAASTSSSGGGGRSLEASMEAINRMKMLKARYGDASAK